MRQVIQGRLTADILSFWHAGGGLGGDFGADAVVRKEDGLPILPGRHLLGLIGHKLEFLRRLSHANVDDAVCACLKGQGADGFDDDLSDDNAASLGPDATRFESEPGALMIETARLDAAWHRHASALSARAQARYGEPFYRRFGSTRLKDGVADDHTLRHTEVVVPMALTANIAIDRRRLSAEAAAQFSTLSDEALMTAVEQAVGLVQGVGRHRTRGLGRARLSVLWSTQEGK